MLPRYRVQLVTDRTREITRLELVCEDASVKLSSVAASLTSVSAPGDADRADELAAQPPDDAAPHRRAQVR
jgi:hypothetical protein